MFAVRRPAVRPGHRPSEGGLPARRDGRLTPAPAADRSWHRDERGLPVSVPGRRTLARFLLAPADDALRAPARAAVSGPVVGSELMCADDDRTEERPKVAVSGPVVEAGLVRADDGRTAEWRESGPVRVLPGRPVDWYPQDAAPRLGPTTAGLLARHVSEVRPAGARRACAPAAVPEITRRERRPLPGAPAPRVR